MTRKLVAAILAAPILAFAQTAEPVKPAPAAEPAKPAVAAEAAKPAEPAKAVEPVKAAPAGGLTIADAKLATSVVDREPQGAGESFGADVGKVYCWTKVTGGAGSEITHVWYRGAEKVNEVKLQIKHAATRTWSMKSIPAEWKGEWRVEVVGPDGVVLKKLSFKIG